MYHNNLPPELQEVLERELEPGERIEWSGQPHVGWLSRESLPLLLFGIPWTAFAVFWTGAAYSMTLEAGPRAGQEKWLTLFPLFGIPFILMGLAILLAPFWIARKLRRTIYAITDRRVILLEGGGSRTVRSVRPDHLTDILRRERSDGSGDIVLKQRGQSGSIDDLTGPSIALLRIPDVQDVERRLRALAATASADSSLDSDE